MQDGDWGHGWRAPALAYFSVNAVFLVMFAAAGFMSWTQCVIMGAGTRKERRASGPGATGSMSGGGNTRPSPAQPAQRSAGALPQCTGPAWPGLPDPTTHQPGTTRR